MATTPVTVGILSDSHGVLHPDIRDRVNGCDFIIHAGDIFTASVLDQLKPGIDLVAVAGNNDIPAVWPEPEWARVNALPNKAELRLPGGKLVVEHGHRLGNKPDHEQLRWDHADARVIVYGHTHHRVIDDSAEPWVINPGASGEVRAHGGPGCLVLTASETSWNIEEFVFDQLAA